MITVHALQRRPPGWGQIDTQMFFALAPMFRDFLRREAAQQGYTLPPEPTPPPWWAEPEAIRAVNRHIQARYARA